MLELLTQIPTVKDGANTFTFKSGTIRFDNVVFSYDGKADTIKNFNFYAGTGQKIALVGETGGGKSTILKLLFRFYDVQDGKIEIDGQDIKTVTLQSLRECIGMVPQSPALFNESIMQNIRYAKLEASDDEVMEACKGAAIHDKILTFSEGYQTRVGENGVKLSGGELQRVAIARVILKNPDIVLLDEATSAVDTETEFHIQEALEKLTKGRTTITIAHRLSTVMNADVIVVIKGGQIVEQGSPHALLEAKGKFSELWLRQVGVVPVSKDEKPDGGDLIDLNDCVPGDKPHNHSDPPEALENGAITRSSEASSSSGKSLRPTAPEFVPQTGVVPRNQRGTASKGTQVSRDRNTTGKQYDGKSSNAIGSYGVHESQQKRKVLNDRLTETADSDSQWETTAVNRNEPRKKRSSPTQRRRNTQTDPSDSASHLAQDEKLGDAPSRAAPGDNGPMSSKPRRVSAPGGPLSNATNVGGVGSKQRRRARPWQNKKRKTPALSSINTSGEGSGAASSDTLHPSTPVEKLPMPKENAVPTNGSVHFSDGI